MTREEFWTQLDEVCASPNRSQSLLQMNSLLQEAYQADLPLLIACTRTPGRIHHSYTMFDPSNPDLVGNRYLICFTDPDQTRRQAPTQTTEPHEDVLSLEERFKQIDEENASTTDKAEEKADLSLTERFRLIDEGGEVSSPKKARRVRRKKSKNTSPLWTTNTTEQTATVPARVVIDYMRRNRAVGGLVFNVYDEKRSVAIPKFMIG